MTVSSTPDRPNVMLPPKRKVTVMGWLRTNLFNSLFNSALTLISLALIYGAISGFVGWAFGEETQWGVIADNFKLFTSGTYPAESLWRVWVVFGLVMFAIGVAGGAWQGLLRSYAAGVGVVLIFLAIAFFIGNQVGSAEDISVVAEDLGSSGGLGYFFVNQNAPELLLEVSALTFIGLGLGWKREVLKTATIVSWLGILPICYVILVSGLFQMEPLETSAISGLLLTLTLAATSLIIAFPIGILLALGRNNDELPVIKWACTITIEVIRGVPLTTILFAVWLVLPIFMGGISVDILIRITVGLILFTAVYVAEDIRGGLQSISRGQVEAARALGLNPFQITMLVVLPQALKAAIPAIVNEFLTLFKDTSLVFIVGMVELLGAAEFIYNQPNWLGTQQEVLVFTGVLYFIFCYAMAFAAKRVEQTLGLGRALNRTVVAARVVREGIGPFSHISHDRNNRCLD